MNEKCVDLVKQKSFISILYAALVEEGKSNLLEWLEVALQGLFMCSSHNFPVVFV